MSRRLAARRALQQYQPSFSTYRDSSRSRFGGGEHHQSGVPEEELEEFAAHVGTVVRGVVKTQFGTWWYRLIRGGVLLTPIEQRLLEAFGENMPVVFQRPLREQLDAINLAQRHVEWRGIQLYRLKRGKVDHSELPPLPCKDGEIKLLSLRIRVPGALDPFHVAFWAVHRFFFGFGTGESLRPVRTAQRFIVEQVTHSWRSNVTRLLER